MTTYEKSFKEEAVRLSDEIGVKLAASQLGIPYWTLADWRAARRARGSRRLSGAGIGCCRRMRRSVRFTN